ncbi:MAG TPA: ATP-binding protein [Vicinamibacterales bacterium]|nr:ATP-binding protein [Vicinamibacterales bacterium]
MTIASAVPTVQDEGAHAETRTFAWQAMPSGARLYVAVVIVAGVCSLVGFVPRTYPPAGLFLFALFAACLTSAWKINLPISLASGSTLSVSYAADLMALLLLGPRAAVIIAAVGVWTQCTVNVRQRYPLYRTVFSIAAEVITMAATGLVYQALGGTTGPFDVTVLMKPLVGAIATYFCINTGLVAGAIAFSTGRPLWNVWREDFLWSATSFMVAGSAGAIAAVVIDRGEHWTAVLMLAPVYLTYRTYRLFVARLEDQKQHMSETRRLLDEMIRLKQAREELLDREQAARASAEAANRLKDQFLATVSHELRTPLSAILGWAEMLRTGMLTDERRDRASEAIFNNAKRQAQLIDELLDMARIMSGKLPLERTAVDPREIVGGALETVQPAAEAKRIQIAIDIDPRVDAFHGDPPRLQQVLWNLLSNAVKFTPAGGTVQVRVRRSGSAGEILVTDSGAGIPRDFLPSVFEPFRQADGSRTRLHGGLGLGLAIVKHLVEAHSGTVDVDSAGEGQGATFTVRLPLVLPTERTRPVPYPSAEDRRSSSLSGVSVLVVDDDEESRMVVAAYLQTHHATVLTAASAGEALDVLQREHVDVLLADVAMPGEDGYTLLRKLRALHASRAATIPAAALTAFARDEDRQEALLAGFQMHLTKPIDASSLVAAVAMLSQVSPI